MMSRYLSKFKFLVSKSFQKYIKEFVGGLYFKKIEIELIVI